MDGTIALMLIEALLIILALPFSVAIRFISPSHDSNQPVAIDNSSKDDDDDDVILSQTVSPPSSYIVVSPPAIKYDVFLSFRGEDTRHTFTSYLYKGLRNAGIHTFMDNELPKGENISPLLLRKIEQSEISVIIFSQNFANSTWCMEELVHILECKKKFGRVVIPIFYDVNPSNIRKLNGSFGKGFDVLKRRFKDNQDKLQRWRNALVQSASLSGWDSYGIRPEFILVEEIVKDILSKLNYKSSSHLERLVGIADHIENIEKLLSEAHIVGIWGMGGAGKTTLAKAIFQELRAQFDAISFKNVKEELARISSDELQLNCLKELLEDKKIKIYDIKSPYVRRRLQRKKILLILDDVNDSKISEDLTKVCDWFGEGSKIIITSRDMQVLKNASAVSTYNVPALDFDDAFLLFSFRAFKQNQPFQDYKELSKSVVEYCRGNPLALVVSGCFLYGRKKKEWKSALVKLDQSPHADIFDVLKLSFDGLDDRQQNVFLDLTFFTMVGGNVSLNIIKESFGPSVHIEISVLKERSLISLTHNGYYIEMHDLVRKMGLEIARQQLVPYPKTPVRLWSHEDIDRFFTRNKEIEEIRCLSIDASKIKRFTLKTSYFRKMLNLVFLEVYKSDKMKPSRLNICEDLDYLPEELRFFSWEEYPLTYVPLHFCAENLVTLRMPNSNIQKLWNGNQHFPNLKKIYLSHSKHLIAVPDLCHTPKIETVLLDGCVNLAQIHSSTNLLENYVQLYRNDSGPVQINIGGNIKGTNSGLMIVHKYLDLDNLTFDKVTMKIFVSGKIISGVRFRHVIMPLAKKPELRKGIQSLASLLPFARKVDWSESPIVFGDNFNQYFTYHPHYDHNYRRHSIPDSFTLRMNVRIKKGEKECNNNSQHHHGKRRRRVFRVIAKLPSTNRGERGGVEPLRREKVNDNQKEIINHDADPVAIKKAEEEEEEKVDDNDDELIIMEYCGCNILTRVPKSITRWSLLTLLTLKESEIIVGNEGCNIDQVSILKSLALSHDYGKSIQPHLDVKLSLRDYSFCIHHNADITLPTYKYFRSLWFGCLVHNYRSLDYDVECTWISHGILYSE